jgi:hypothetical protein
MQRWIAAAAVGIAISGPAMSAHHSIAAAYDGGRQVTVTGVVSQFLYVTPHPILGIDVVDGAGAPQQWRLEMDNRSELTEVGMSADTLKRGDRVVVTGSPGRTQPHTLYIRRLERPADGFWYEQVGTRPRIGGSGR